jgi:hypothetical protein
VIGAYHGYATQQAAKLERKYIEQGETTYQMRKHLCHMCRLMLAGAHVVTTGEIMVTAPDASRQALLDIKSGVTGRQQAMDYFTLLQQEFERAVQCCRLPDKPALAPLNDLLLAIRHAY